MTDLRRTAYTVATDRLRLEIDGDGCVKRCVGDLRVPVVGEKYQPLTCEPLRCETDARRLLERARAAEKTPAEWQTP